MGPFGAFLYVLSNGINVLSANWQIQQGIPRKLDELARLTSHQNTFLQDSDTGYLQ